MGDDMGGMGGAGGRDLKMLMDLIMKALQVSGYADRGGGDDGLAGMNPHNRVQGWSGIQLTRGPDERPAISDKDYFIEKLALNEGQEMPHDSSMNFTQPF
jgi:phage replication-related protein YjqB (UPF0714/DUF867 family)